MINIFWPYYNKNGITDQIYALIEFFKRNDIEWQLSNRLCTYSKNITIENLDEDNSNYIINFCEIHKLKVIILVTEFLSKNEKNQYFVNDIIDPIDISSANKNNNFVNRFLFLKKISRYIESFVSIFNIPNLSEYKDFYGINNIYSIDVGFSSKNTSLHLPIYDFYFSGALTNYRKNILDDLSKNYKVLVEKNFIKDQDRISNMAKCKYSLNIPQSSSWKGDSLMRILFSLRNDKLVLSFNKNSINMGQLSKYIIDYDEFLRDKDSKRMKISIPNALHTNYFHEDELRLASSIKNSIF